MSRVPTRTMERISHERRRGLHGFDAQQMLHHAVRRGTTKAPSRGRREAQSGLDSDWVKATLRAQKQLRVRGQRCGISGEGNIFCTGCWGLAKTPRGRSAAQHVEQNTERRKNNFAGGGNIVGLVLWAPVAARRAEVRTSRP